MTHFYLLSASIYVLLSARFLKAGMNIVDLLGILPYFASLILSLVMTATARGRETANYQASYRDSNTALCVLYL